MNELILVFAKRCGDWNGETVEMNDVGIQEFAQLIINECAFIVSSTPCPNLDKDHPVIDVWDMACVEAAKRIRRNLSQ